MYYPPKPLARLGRVPIPPIVSAENEVMLGLVGIAPSSPIDLLLIAVDSKCLDGVRAGINGASSPRGLGLRELITAAVTPGQLLLDGNAADLEINVAPTQAEQLPQPHTRLGSRAVERKLIDVRYPGQEARQLCAHPKLDLRLGLGFGQSSSGRVNPDQPMFDCVLKRPMQTEMHIPHRLGLSSRPSLPPSIRIAR